MEVQAPTPDRKPFDEAVAEEIRAALLVVALRHPEAAAFAVSVAWVGDLNEAAMSGLWIGADGQAVRDPATIVGSVRQTVKMIDTQLGRLAELTDGYTDKLRALGQELARKYEELEKAKAQVTAEGGDAGGPAGPI